MLLSLIYRIFKLVWGLVVWFRFLNLLLQHKLTHFVHLVILGGQILPMLSSGISTIVSPLQLLLLRIAKGSLSLMFEEHLLVGVQLLVGELLLLRILSYRHLLLLVLLGLTCGLGHHLLLTLATCLIACLLHGLILGSLHLSISLALLLLLESNKSCLLRSQLLLIKLRLLPILRLILELKCGGLLLLLKPLLVLNCCLLWLTHLLLNLLHVLLHIWRNTS